MYRPIELMEPGYLGALAFKGSGIDPAWLYYVVQIAETLEYGPWDQASIIDITSSRVQAAQRPKDPLADPDNEILYIKDDDPPTLLHVSAGMSHTFLKCYVHYTESQAARGQWPNLDPINSGTTIGDYQVGFWGHQSPYDNPTTAGELWLPPKVYVALGFYNAGNFDVRPSLRFAGQKLHIRPLVPSGNEGTPDNRLIRKMAEGKVRYTRGYVGSMDSLVAMPKRVQWTELVTEERARTLPLPVGGA